VLSGAHPCVYFPFHAVNYTSDPSRAHLPAYLDQFLRDDGTPHADIVSAIVLKMQKEPRILGPNPPIDIVRLLELSAAVSNFKVYLTTSTYVNRLGNIDLKELVPLVWRAAFVDMARIEVRQFELNTEHSILRVECVMNMGYQKRWRRKRLGIDLKKWLISVGVSTYHRTQKGRWTAGFESDD
jgi:hypothetical protein